MTPNEWQVLEQMYAAERPSDYPSDLNAALEFLRQRQRQEDIESYLDWQSLPAQKLKAVCSLVEAGRKPLREYTEEELESWMKFSPEDSQYELSQFIEETVQMLKERSHAG